MPRHTRNGFTTFLAELSNYVTSILREVVMMCGMRKDIYGSHLASGETKMMDWPSRQFFF